jgi:hypothetical protein
MLLSCRREARCAYNLAQLCKGFCLYFCDTVKAGRGFLKIVSANGLSNLWNGRYRFAQPTDGRGEI